MIRFNVPLVFLPLCVYGPIYWAEILVVLLSGSMYMAGVAVGGEAREVVKSVALVLAGGRLKWILYEQTNGSF